MENPNSANLREYCGWTGNTEDDIVTTGTIYHDTASKGYSKSGKRVFKDCYRAEITISGQRRHRGCREGCIALVDYRGRDRREHRDRR